MQKPFAAAALGVLGSTVILHGSFILVPLAVEELLGESATTSGIVLLGLAGIGALRLRPSAGASRIGAGGGWWSSPAP